MYHGYPKNCDVPTEIFDQNCLFARSMCEFSNFRLEIKLVDYKVNSIQLKNPGVRFWLTPSPLS